MAPLHKETICDYFTELFSNPISAVAWLLWVANILAMYRITYWVVPPYEYIIVQAGLGILHMIISHLELIWIPYLMEHKARQHQSKPLRRGKSSMQGEEMQDALSKAQSAKH